MISAGLIRQMRVRRTRFRAPHQILGASTDPLTRQPSHLLAGGCGLPETTRSAPRLRELRKQHLGISRNFEAVAGCLAAPVISGSSGPTGAFSYPHCHYMMTCLMLDAATVTVSLNHV